MSDKEKISDNHSSKEILDGLKGVEALSALYGKIPGAKLLFPKLEEAFSGLPDINKQAEILLLPDKFNNKFSQFGWIAYESLNVDLMKNALDIEKEKGIKEAEMFLADYYDEESLHWLVMRFNGHPEFRKRLRLVELAKEDYLAERYHACVPLILSLTDGIVNDVSKHVGLFAENSDMTAWDSIAAHETGLQTLVNILGKGRAKTNEDEITIPYRNGILHGRELAFDNKGVAAKCWSTIFAVRDWADSLAEGKKTPREPDKKSFREVIKDHSETRALTKRIEKWSKRSWLKTHDWSTKSSIDELESSSPEYAVSMLFEYWKKCQWGKASPYIADFLNTPKGKKAGQIKNDFSHIKIIDYKLLSVLDETPAFSKLMLKVMYEHAGNAKETTLEVHASYNDSDSLPILRGEPDGSWQVNQAAFVSLIYDYK